MCSNPEIERAGAQGTLNHSVKESHCASAYISVRGLPFPYHANRRPAVPRPTGGWGEGEDELNQPGKATGRWACAPRPSADRRIWSPALRNFGDLKPAPTPDGVPVGITSPG